MTPARKRDWITAAWIVGTIALIAFIEHERAAQASTGIGVQPGLMTGVRTPSGGIALFILPSGGHWIQAVDSTSANVPRTLPLPGDITSPLSVAVAPGTTVALQWHDAAGAAQTTFVGFV